jgi:Asp-tRNA(Asn)/Glu-tRNA(Gln) amidotransferase A subunit family amidase
MVGKTNMDQFASGLVGTRTPYGTACNAFDDRFIPGGSSSGSAPLVANSLVSFALGTDTAGSGGSFPALDSEEENLGIC